jgi:hypothetical protein
MKNLRSAFLLFLIGCCFPLLAQQAKTSKRKIPLIVEVQYSGGKVVPVYPHFPHTTFANAVELHIGYETNGSKVWHRLFNYPRLGVSFLYQNLGNNRVMGQQISVIPTVYFSTARKENAKVFAEIRYGLGLACFTRPYDSISNPDNKGAGSYATWQFTVGANLRWNFSRYASFQLGGIWYHASNAHTQLPNVGVNNFAIYAGILAYPFGRFARAHDKDTAALDKNWHVNFRFGEGWQERGSAFGHDTKTKFPVYCASVYASKRLAKILMAKVGFTYRYYSMYESFLKDFSVTDSKLTLKSSAFVLFIGTEFMLGHFSISLEAGVNVYKPAYQPFYNHYEKSSAFNYYTKQYIATRFGANYYLFDPYLHPRNNVFIGAFVNANLGQAEFFEFNVGYVF